MNKGFFASLIVGFGLTLLMLGAVALPPFDGSLAAVFSLGFLIIFPLLVIVMLFLVKNQPRTFGVTLLEEEENEDQVGFNPPLSQYINPGYYRGQPKQPLEHQDYSFVHPTTAEEYYTALYRATSQNPAGRQSFPTDRYSEEAYSYNPGNPAPKGFRLEEEGYYPQDEAGYYFTPEDYELSEQNNYNQPWGNPENSSYNPVEQYLEENLTGEAGQIEEGYFPDPRYYAQPVFQRRPRKISGTPGNSVRRREIKVYQDNEPVDAVFRTIGEV